MKKQEITVVIYRCFGGSKKIHVIKGHNKDEEINKFRNTLCNLALFESKEIEI